MVKTYITRYFTIF